MVEPAINRAEECRDAFVDAFAQEIRSSEMILLAVFADDGKRPFLPGLIESPSGEQGSYRHSLGCLELGLGGQRQEVGFVLQTWPLFGFGDVFEWWLAPARKSGATLLANGWIPNDIRTSESIIIWAATVLQELHKTSWMKATEYPEVFQFAAGAASLETWRRLIERRVGTGPGTGAPVDCEIAGDENEIDRIKWLAEAMLLVQKHPDWSDRSIARTVRKSPSVLSRSKVYQAAAKIARGDKLDLRKGHRTFDADSGLADIEAADFDDPSEREF